MRESAPISRALDSSLAQCMLALLASSCLPAPTVRIGGAKPDCLWILDHEGVAGEVHLSGLRGEVET